MMKNPNSSSVEAAWQWIAPTLRSAELFYTKNGLPIDEDNESEKTDDRLRNWAEQILKIS